MKNHACQTLVFYVSLVLISFLALPSTPVIAADYDLWVLDPPITDHLILDTGPLPPVCKKTQTIRVRACPGEYEPASFIVETTTSMVGVRIEVGRLNGEMGQWTEKAVDVRVVKPFVRETYGGAAAIPTLLVHDEDFLAIEPDPTEEDPNRMKNVVRGALRDAQTLQPVTIEHRKQFWLTVHVPKNARPGTYKTKIRIIPYASEPSDLTLEVEVYPFDLLQPMLEYSIYYPVELGRNLPPDNPMSFGDITERQYLEELKNMLAHGISNPNIYSGVATGSDGTLDFSALEKVLDLRESIGMKPKTLYLVSHPVPFEDRPLREEERQKIARNVNRINAWARQRGYQEVFYMGKDELWGERLSAERDSMVAVREAGGNSFVAVMNPNFFDRVGDVLDRPILQADVGARISYAIKKYSLYEAMRRMPDIAQAGSFEHMSRSPKFRKAIDGAHRNGHRIFAYMNPIAGTPLPDLQRRNQGLGLWRVGFDGTMNWAYTHIERVQGQQEMRFQKVYRTTDGVLDTLHWEGFREGVDDVRYLTTLLMKLGQVSGTFPNDPLVADTYTWLGGINVAEDNLDTIRREMAQRIIALQNLGYRERSWEDILAKINLDQVQVTTFPEPWRFKIDPDDKGMNEKWFDLKVDDGVWATVRTDMNLGWDKQGFNGKQANGYGWYQNALPHSGKNLGMKFSYLYFEAVDEEAWLYLNGRHFFEHTVKSTGLMVEELWLTPFTVPLEDVEFKGEDILTVRVHNSGGMGGIWKPVHLIQSDQELSPEQLYAVMKRHQQKVK